MNKIFQKILIFSFSIGFLGCKEKYSYDNYPKGYDTKYIVGFDYRYSDVGEPSLANVTINVNKKSEELLEMPIKFFSENIKDFDVEVRLYFRNSHYFLKQQGIITATRFNFSTPDSLALPGIDFNLLNKKGEILTPIKNDSLMYYSIIFPKAIKGVEKLYIKPLDYSGVNHIRSAWFTLVINKVVTNETEVVFNETSLNNSTNNYSVSALSNSYLRRINFINE
ncbi:hypothetical protein [Pseudopedobacter beijingensis]|uniref:DUF4843 domain-containing protein n=1 Tax=Pseudopedobacter beijingensis TaxID=1207056 RepID=A0ABW4IAH1_9SPHI